MKDTTWTLHTFLLIGICIFAYSIRIYKPEVFISDVDYSGHVVASLRLFSTSLFQIHKPTANLFVQLFSFSHGYVTIGLPSLLYGLVFKLLKLPVTETNLVFINSLIGIVSILAFYRLAKELYNERVALWSALIYSLLPIHISLSRLHVGNQVFQSIFFFLSTTYLIRLLKTNALKNKIFYFVFICFLIGSDNVFPLAIFLQFTLIVLQNRKNIFQTIKKVITPLYISLPLAVGPAVLYIMMDIIRVKKYGMNAPGGFLLRTLTKTGHFAFSPLQTLQWAGELIGPVCIFFIIIFCHKRILPTFREKFLLFNIILYTLFLSIGTNIERNYIFSIAGALVLFTVQYLQNKRHILVLICLLTAVYSLSVIYSLPIGFPTTKTYGSIGWNETNNDSGVKTLGYLVRKGILPVGQTINDKVTKLDVCFDFLGGWYYLGNYYFDLPNQDLSAIKNKKDMLFVVQPSSNDPASALVAEFVKNNNLSQVGEVRNGKVTLLSVYSFKNQPLKKYQVSEFNQKFDKEYGNIESLGKLYLGIY